MKLYEHIEAYRKCSICGSVVDEVYALKSSEEEAEKTFSAGKGACAKCTAAGIYMNGYEITKER